jgi:hypothetical protein
MNLAKVISKFINAECSVCEANLFCFIPDENIITFTFQDDYESNFEWKKYLKNCFNFELTNENLFSMSILHELGHYHTINLFNPTEWEEQATEMVLEKVPEEERIQSYFKMPIEQAATAWAVKYYNENELKMRKWNHRFNCAIKHYEKKHPIHFSKSLLTKL